MQLIVSWMGPPNESKKKSLHLFQFCSGILIVSWCYVSLFSVRQLLVKCETNSIFIIQSANNGDDLRKNTQQWCQVCVSRIAQKKNCKNEVDSIYRSNALHLQTRTEILSTVWRMYNGTSLWKYQSVSSLLHIMHVDVEFVHRS